MNEKQTPDLSQFPLPPSKQKVMGAGIKDGCIVLTLQDKDDPEPKPFAKFNIPEASILCCKLMALCARLANRVTDEMVNDAFQQIEQTRQQQKSHSGLILPKDGNHSGS